MPIKILLIKMTELFKKMCTLIFKDDIFSGISDKASLAHLSFSSSYF